MPLFCFFFFLACLGNLGLPGTSNFIGEILVFFSILFKNKFIFFFILPSVVLSSIYSLYLYTRLANGNTTFYIKVFSDLMPYEIIISLFLIILILFFGILPNTIFETINASHFLLLERIKL